MYWTNYHQHCHYDDGKERIMAYASRAMEQNVVSMGFSCHSPVPFENNWSLKAEDISAYLKEIEDAKKAYEGRLEIYRSLEIDFIPGMSDLNAAWIKELNLDYTLGSVHFVGAYENGRPWEIDGPHHLFLDGLQNIHHGDVKKVVCDYFELTRQMVRTACPDIIGHLDKIKMQNRGFWREEDDWYKNEILTTLEEIRATSAIVEVNTRGLYKKLTSEPYPGRWVLEQIFDMKIPVQINSDAHLPREMTLYFSEMAGLLKAIGFKHLSVFRDRDWQPVLFDESGLQIS